MAVKRMTVLKKKEKKGKRKTFSLLECQQYALRASCTLDNSNITMRKVEKPVAVDCDGTRTLCFCSRQLKLWLRTNQGDYESKSFRAEHPPPRPPLTHIVPPSNQRFEVSEEP